MCSPPFGLEDIRGLTPSPAPLRRCPCCSPFRFPLLARGTFSHLLFYHRPHGTQWHLSGPVPLQQCWARDEAAVPAGPARVGFRATSVTGKEPSCDLPQEDVICASVLRARSLRTFPARSGAGLGGCLSKWMFQSGKRQSAPCVSAFSFIRCCHLYLPGFGCFNCSSSLRLPLPSDWMPSPRRSRFQRCCSHSGSCD